MYKAFYNHFLPRYLYSPYQNSVEDKMGSDTFNRMNHPEKFVALAMRYHKGHIGNNEKVDLTNAINKHSLNELIDIVRNEWGYEARGDAMVNFISANSIVNNLYKRIP